MREKQEIDITVDLVIFTIKERKLQVILVKRGIEPFKDMWALPGGFVRNNESLHQAALRELDEEAGVKEVYIEQLYSFGNVDRDPRGRVVTVSYMALVNSDKMELKATADVVEAKWFPVDEMPELAFDHKGIIEYAVKRLRWKFEYTPVGFSMLPEKFSLSQIRLLYETVFNKKFDKRNFAKKIHSLGILKKEGILEKSSHRPPALYSLKKDVSEIIKMT